MTLRLACLSFLAASSLTLTPAPSKAQDPQKGGAPAPAPAPAVAPAAVAPALVPVQLNEAIRKAANALMSKVPEPPGERELVIDPLVDGYTGAQNVATTMMGGNIASRSSRATRFKVVPFTSATVSKQPLLLVGTFRPINTKSDPTGPKDAYHICLAMLDLKTRTVVSKGVARAVPDGIDVTPVQFFQDAPVWIPDPPSPGTSRPVRPRRSVIKLIRPMPTALSSPRSSATRSEPTMASTTGIHSTFISSRARHLAATSFASTTASTLPIGV